MSTKTFLATLPKMELSSLPAFSGFGLARPEAGDLAAVMNGQIVMFAKTKGKGSQHAIGLVRMNGEGRPGMQLVVLA